jgi:hypothetical protein
MKRSILCLTVLLLLFGVVNQVKGYPILDFVGGIAVSPGGDTIGGWEFNVSSPIAVDGLGLWDEGGDGLSGNHAVGLWNSDGTVLLTSTTITNASTPVGSTSPDGRWLFNDIPDLVLLPGTYVLGATFLDNDPDQARLEAAATTISTITFIQARQRTSTSSLTFPDEPIGLVNDGVFGPNLQVAVPEPTTMFLIGSGLLGLAGFRRKLKK